VSSREMYDLLNAYLNANRTVLFNSPKIKAEREYIQQKAEEIGQEIEKRAKEARIDIKKAVGEINAISSENPGTPLLMLDLSDEARALGEIFMSIVERHSQQ